MNRDGKYTQAEVDAIVARKHTEVLCQGETEALFWKWRIRLHGGGPPVLDVHDTDGALRYSASVNEVVEALILHGETI